MRACACRREAFRTWLEESGIWKRFVQESEGAADASVEPPPNSSCPGITYEFEMRPEQEERFNTVVSVLGPMLHHLSKL